MLHFNEELLKHFSVEMRGGKSKHYEEDLKEYARKTLNFRGSINISDDCPTYADDLS
jgi:hypothetical protein